MVCCRLLLAQFRLVLITSWAVKDARLAPYVQEDISLKIKFCCLLLASSSLKQTSFAHIIKCSCQKWCSSILWFVCQKPKINNVISCGKDKASVCTASTAVLPALSFRSSLQTACALSYAGRQLKDSGIYCQADFNKSPFSSAFWYSVSLKIYFN